MHTTIRISLDLLDFENWIVNRWIKETGYKWY